MDGDNNAVAYTAMKDDARIWGDNFRTMRKRKRLLAVNLVKAAVVEGYQLEGIIEDCRKEMKYSRLDKPEQRQAQVFFSDCRTIVGGWEGLEKETREAFLAGELVFSTLAKAIVDARKAADDAEAEAEEVAAAGADASAHAEADCAEPGAQNLSDQSETILAIAELIGTGVLTEDETAAIAVLIETLDAYRAGVAEEVRKAA